MQGGAGPPFQIPPPVGDVRSATGASLRVRAQRWAIAGRRTPTPGGAQASHHNHVDLMKLGVMGGTFDPIHLGHVAMAEAAADCAGLDRVLLIPASVPPHRAAATAPAGDRLAMVRLAAAGHPRLEVSDIELRRAGPSYTADTLRPLARDRPGAELHLL